MGISLVLDSMRWSFEPSAPVFLSVDRLTIGAGESVALTGASGSGKTSLLFLLTGMERPSAGRISWDGFELSAAPESARDRWRRDNVGLMFQDFRLEEDLSVLDNVLLPCTFSQWRPGRVLQARARELMARVGLKKPEQSVATLSRGEMQRTALARALLRQPKLLVADEPTASLDAENERIVWELLFDSTLRDGVTLLIATHQKAIQGMTDRVITLDHGAISSDEARKGHHP